MIARLRSVRLTSPQIAVIAVASAFATGVVIHAATRPDRVPNATLSALRGRVVVHTVASPTAAPRAAAPTPASVSPSAPESVAPLPSSPVQSAGTVEQRRHDRRRRGRRRGRRRRWNSRHERRREHTDDNDQSLEHPQSGQARVRDRAHHRQLPRRVRSRFGRALSERHPPPARHAARRIPEFGRHRATRLPRDDQRPSAERRHRQRVRNLRGVPLHRPRRRATVNSRVPAACTRTPHSRSPTR